MKMNMEHWWNYADGETEGLGEKPGPVLRSHYKSGQAANRRTMTRPFTV